MSRDHSHYTSISGLEDVSLDLTEAERGFDNIMEALDQTAAKMFGVWDGAGEDTARADNEEFRKEYEEVQIAFRTLINANDDVTENTRNMHARLTSIFER